MKSQFTHTFLLVSVLSLTACSQATKQTHQHHEGENLKQTITLISPKVQETKPHTDEQHDAGTLPRETQASLDAHHQTLLQANAEIPLSPTENSVITYQAEQNSTENLEANNQSLQLQAKKPVKKLSADSGLTEQELLAGEAIVDQLQQQLRREPLLGEMQKKLQNEMKVSSRKARQIIDALGKY